MATIRVLASRRCLFLLAVALVVLLLCSHKEATGCVTKGDSISGPWHCLRARIMCRHKNYDNNQQKWKQPTHKKQ
eukprot:6477795-Amphidinium_carterae.5